MATQQPNQFNFTRGQFVLINNVGIDTATTVDFVPRTGARNDSENIKAIFNETFGLTYLNQSGDTKSQDLSIGDWDHRFPYNENGSPNLPVPSNCGRCVRCLVSNHNYEDSDGLVLYISSHGQQDQETGELIIQFLDGWTLPVSEIFHVLSDTEVPSLKGKPRVLVLQACRKVPDDPNTVVRKQPNPLEDKGHNQGHDVQVQKDVKSQHEDPPVQGAASGGHDEINPILMKEEPMVTKLPQRTRKSPIPLPPEFMVVYSTTPGHYSYIDPENGSWLEDEMKQVVTEQASQAGTKVNFLNTMTEVANRLAKRESVGSATSSVPSGMKNALMVQHRLSKPVFFTKK